MYYIIRLFVLLIIGICFYFLRKRKGTSVWKRSKKAVIIRIAVIVLIGLIVFLPYEAPFIRFDSAETSVRYSTLNYNAPIKTVETDKTAFCVGHIRNNFYYNTVTKYDDQYGFCNRHSQSDFGYINAYIDDESFQGTYSVTKLVDNETNEKCYMINFIPIKQTGIKEICIYDEQNTPIEKITFSDNSTIFAIVVNQINEKTAFIFNGKTYELD